MTHTAVCVCVCADRAFLSIYMHIHVQDPPNAALVCEVDGVTTTTAVTLTSPSLSMDDDGMMAISYGAETISMMRGGPSALNATAPAAEAVIAETLVCDDDSIVSLFVDSVDPVTPWYCAPPTSYKLPDALSYIPPGSCFSGFESGQQLCAPGWTPNKTGLMFNNTDFKYCTSADGDTTPPAIP